MRVLIFEIQHFNASNQRKIFAFHFRALLSTIIANFNSTLTPKANESIKIRNKQRIVLKFLIILARSGYGRSVLFSPDMDFPIPVSRVIIESFYSLARFGGEFMAEDIGLLREWNEFDGRLDPEIKPIYESVFQLIHPSIVQLTSFTNFQTNRIEVHE